jgi:hypothetical protein
LAQSLRLPSSAAARHALLRERINIEAIGLVPLPLLVR